MAGELDGADGALEALGVGEHVHVGEDISGVLFAASEGDFGELLDRRVLVARLVTGRAGDSTHLCAWTGRGAAGRGHTGSGSLPRGRPPHSDPRRDRVRRRWSRT